MDLIVVEEDFDRLGYMPHGSRVATGDHSLAPGEEGGGEQLILRAERGVKRLRRDLGVVRDLTQPHILVGARCELLPRAPPLFSGLRPLDGRLGAARDHLLNRFATRLLASGLPALNKARSERQLDPLEDWAAQLLGVQAICVLTAPELDFCSRGALPANVHYVGPAFEPYPTDWTSPWPETNSDPLVLLSFSTSYMNQQALAQRALDAVAGMPVGALLTTGPALADERLRLPANARAVP